MAIIVFRQSIANLNVQQLVKLFLASSISIAIWASFLNSPILANSMVLNSTEVERQIQTLPDWTTDGRSISRTFKFANFVEAVSFVDKLVAPAESAGHHPDIFIAYNKVTISLTTHDAGGITQKDFDLAREISEIVE
jgi:4a-hydroxytetrahydrobiopterin dehydratase